jgi:radical SAM superfamily enzyme YgiQ (UPF0313 family)
MKILLTSVFGPYGVDDEYGRKENIMELFHNQVTREQGIFSIRFHHYSFGLYLIAENISAPTVVLDFPSEKRFTREIKKGYDYIGISFIVPNFVKAKRMAELIRKHAPKSKIILGGHGTKIPEVENMIEHDLFCEGEGVRWFRDFLGEKADRPLRHPVMLAGFQKKMLGGPLKCDSAVLIPGVGCVNACSFCSTSHFFGKKYIPLFDSGLELFNACALAEKKYGCREFFIMDENFLKTPERARQFVDLIEKNNKLYSFHLFSSAETVKNVGIDFLLRLGATFIWIGVESQKSTFGKNKGIDFKKLIRELRDHGISVLASGILFMEHHNKENIRDDIKFIAGLESDFVQFMQLSALPGTALFDEFERRGILKKEIPYEEWHGQHRIWFYHPHFTMEESEKYLREAFRYDYDTQGASVLRIADTIIRGYNNLSAVNKPFMKRRIEVLKENAYHYRPILKALKILGHTEHARKLAEDVINKYDKTMGPMPLLEKIYSDIVLISGMLERRRWAKGKTVSQPRTFCTKYRM